MNQLKNNGIIYFRLVINVYVFVRHIVRHIHIV